MRFKGSIWVSVVGYRSFLKGLGLRVWRVKDSGCGLGVTSFGDFGFEDFDSGHAFRVQGLGFRRLSNHPEGRKNLQQQQQRFGDCRVALRQGARKCTFPEKRRV